MEASIIQRINELKQWQRQQQERLLKQQQQQCETLTYQQDCMFRALELSVQNISSDNSEVNADDSFEINSSNKNVSLSTSKNLPLTMNKSGILEIKKSLGMISLSCDNRDESKDSERSLNLKENSANCSTNGSTVEDFEENFIEPNLESENKALSEKFLMEGITPLSLDKPTVKSMTIDDIPVPSPKKDFQSLLEEKLRSSEYTANGNVDVNSKGNVKKPFLKKGQGLARFRLNKSSTGTGEIAKPRCSSASANVGRNKGIYTEKKKEPIVKHNFLKKNVHVPSVKQPLNLKDVPPPKKKNHDKPVFALPAIRQIMNGADLSSSDLESKTERELEEVRMFELLEEKAENSSFCSTSSTVLAFLQQSSPFKTRRMFSQVSNGATDFTYKNDQRPKKLEQSLSRVDENTAKPMEKNNVRTIESRQTLKYSPNQVVDAYWESVTHTQENRFISVKGNSHHSHDKSTNIEGDVYNVKTHRTRKNSEDRLNNHRPYEFSNPADDNEADISLHVRFSEYNEYKTFGLTDTSSVSSESSRSYADERAWSDCSPIPSISDERIPQEDNSTCMHGSSDEEEERDDNLALLDKNDTLQDEVNEELDIISIGNKINKSDSFIITQPTASVRPRAAVETDSKSRDETIFKSELLKTRLLELEGEIDIFRKENAALSVQRRKLQEERESLYKEMKEKQEEFEKTKIRAEERLNEEKKKLARDKAAFEIRIRDAQEKNQLYKLERLEAQKLKQELQELKEEVREKESRWNAAHSRQKSQLRILKVENTKLKTEFERLESMKKSNVQRRKSTNYSNTRAINRINKQLDGCTKPTAKEQASEEDDENQIKSMMESLRSVTGEYNGPVENTQIDSGKSSENLQQDVSRVITKRNLYEHLLKEAVTGLLETEEVRKSVNTLSTQKDFSVKKPTESQRSNADDTGNTKLDGPIQQNKSPDSVSSGSHLHSPKIFQEAIGKVNMENTKVVHHSDGHIEHWYTNGNVKKIFPEQGVVKMLYYNGDVCETQKNGNVKYFYASTRTWHTTMPDGLEILEFPDGQVERRSKNGNVEISFPDGSLRMLQSDGSEKWVFPDGTVAETFSNGEKVLNLPNGQREVHTQEYKRREYPDGTVKLLYPDGTQETRYSNGRVRLKDKDGNLLMDSQQQNA